jgi:hypothetical protein
MNKAARDTREQVSAAATDVRSSIEDVQKDLASADATKETPHGGA